MLLLPLAAMGQGRLYERFASRADLTVAQVSGFKLNDTARVDVVLVVADNDRAWQSLRKELGIKAAEGTTSWLGQAAQPERRTAWTGRPVCRVVASEGRRTIGFYVIENEGQYDALLDYQLNAASTKKSSRR